MNKKIVHYSKVNNKIKIEEETLKEYIKLTKEISKLEKKLKPIESQLKEELKNAMEEIGTNKYNEDGIVASITSAYIKSSLDTNALKTNDFELYCKYLKTTDVASSIKLGVE